MSDPTPAASNHGPPVQSAYGLPGRSLLVHA
jgi:hypothetical protein